MIKRRLFFGNRYRGGRRGQAAAGADNFERAFGSVVPKDSPESTAWWRERVRELDRCRVPVKAGRERFSHTSIRV